MTLCIAGVCWQGKSSRIVVSSDWKQESGYASAENQDKLFWIRDDWPVLVAGTMARAVLLKDTYRTYLDRNKALLAAVFRSETMDVLNEPLKLFKHKLADEFIGSRLGISYDVFLTNGKAWLPENTFNDLLTAVRRITLECQILFPIFVCRDPFIYRINDEILEPCDNFAAIGTGMEIAESVLSQRKQNEQTTGFAKTIYHIFEAGKLASLAPPPGVGKDHTICVFYPPENGKLVCKEITSKGYQVLEKKYKQFGPRRVTSFSFEDKFLEEIEFD